METRWENHKTPLGSFGGQVGGQVGRQLQHRAQDRRGKHKDTCAGALPSPDNGERAIGKHVHSHSEFMLTIKPFLIYRESKTLWLVLCGLG